VNVEPGRKSGLSVKWEMNHRGRRNLTSKDAAQSQSVIILKKFLRGNEVGTRRRVSSCLR